LRAPELNTILSRRDYRTGAWHLAALWPRAAGARWDLAALRDAMRRPGFVPYLGRKSCPLGLPLAPAIAAAASPAAALLARHEDGPEGRFRADMAARPAARLTVALDAGDAGGDTGELRVEMRRDQPRDRLRWQFDLRAEAILAVPPT
jgi:CRISPR system Cascade subunit CasD